MPSSHRIILFVFFAEEKVLWRCFLLTFAYFTDILCEARFAVEEREVYDFQIAEGWRNRVGKAFLHVPSAQAEEDGKNELAIFLRWYGIAGQVMLELTGLSLVGWLGSLFGSWYIACALFAPVIIILFSFTLWTRQQHNKTIRLSNRLHDVCHCMRDATSEIPTALENNNVTQYKALYKEFNNEVANRIARYFEELIGERKVCCAIRCAVQGEEKGTEVFQTVGRSSEMLKDQRERLSVPIPGDKGVARMLRQKDNFGVLYVWDIKEAGNNDDVWIPTPTDKLEDVKKVMVAPINGYMNGQKKVLGLLYVTTVRKKPKVKYAGQVMAFADMLGLVYPIITHNVADN